MLKHCAQFLRGIRGSLSLELHSPVGRRWCQYDLWVAPVGTWLPKQNPVPPSHLKSKGGSSPQFSKMFGLWPHPLMHLPSVPSPFSPF